MQKLVAGCHVGVEARRANARVEAGAAPQYPTSSIFLRYGYEITLQFVYLGCGTQ